MSRSRVRDRKSLHVSLTALLACLPAAVSAQGFFEVVEVPAVEIDVVVTDRRGRPVTDLDREAFRLTVDGQEEPITFFSPPAPGQPAGDAGGMRRPTSLVIVFDNNGVESRARNAVIEDLREYLQGGFDPQLRILVATVGASGLDIEQELTTDRDQVDAALARVAATVTRDRQLTDYETLLLDIQRLAGARDPTRTQLRAQAMHLVGQIQAFADQARQETGVTGGYLWQLVESLAGLPGRRTLLFVGGALSIAPGEALLAALREALARTADAGAHQIAGDLPPSLSQGDQDAVEELAAAASAERVAFYSIVVGGERSVALGGGSAGALVTGDSSATEGSDIWSPGVEFRNRMETATAHEILAVATGGFVHRGGRSVLRAFERLEGELEEAYRLGFHPAAGVDDTPHRVEVEVGGRKLEVRHRQTFQVRGWDRAAAAALRSDVYLGTGQNLMAMGIELRPAEEVTPESVRLPVTLQIPLSGIALEPVGTTHRAQLSVFWTASEKRFDSQPVRKSVLPIVLPNAELQSATGSVASYRLDLEISPATRWVGIGVRDDLASELSTLTVDLTQPAPVVVSREAPTEAAGRSLAPDEARLDLPVAALLLSGQSGGPLPLSAVASAERLADDRWRVVVDVRVNPPPSGSESVLEAFVQAQSKTGEILAGTSRLVEWDDSPPDPSGPSAAHTELPLELDAGSYVLRVAVRDRRSREFGVTGMMIEMTGTADEILRWTSEPLQEAALAEPVVSSAPRASGRSPAASYTLILRRYRSAIEAVARGDAVGARRAIRELELGVTDGRPANAVVDLGRLEGKVLVDLGREDWSRMLPLAILYGDLIEEYRRGLKTSLAENAILVSSRLAQQMARQAKGEAATGEAADLLTSLAGHLLYAQRLVQTEELLELAVKSVPDSSAARLALAAIREVRGDYKGAVAALESLLELDPDHLEGRLRLAVNLAREGASEHALDEFDRVVDSASAAEVWMAQVAVQEAARLRLERGDFDRARRDLEAAVEHWPEQPSLRVQLAWSLEAAGQPLAAREWIEGLADEAHRAEDSARYRYVEWHTVGLEPLRDELVVKSRARARQWLGEPAGPATGMDEP